MNNTRQEYRLILQKHMLPKVELLDLVKSTIYPIVTTEMLLIALSFLKQSLKSLFC